MRFNPCVDNQNIHRSRTTGVPGYPKYSILIYDTCSDDFTSIYFRCSLFFVLFLLITNQVLFQRIWAKNYLKLQYNSMMKTLVSFVYVYAFSSCLSTSVIGVAPRWRVSYLVYINKCTNPRNKVEAKTNNWSVWISFWYEKSVHLGETIVCSSVLEHSVLCEI